MHSIIQEFYLGNISPDATAIRQTSELKKAAQEGYQCYAAFVIQMEGITEVRPNIETHKEFGEALEEAENAGVKVLYLGCAVTEDTLEIAVVREAADGNIS